MRVLGVVITHPFRTITGATSAAYQLSLSISRTIPYTLAMMVDENRHYTDGGLEIYKFSGENILSKINNMLPRWVYIPLYYSRIPQFIENGNFELVHIHNPIPTFAMKEIAKACIRKGIPYCISSHGFMEILNYSSIMNFGLFKKILTNIAINKPFTFVVKKAAWIFTLSPIEGEILKKLNFPINRSSVLTNGVNDFFRRDPPKSEILELEIKLGLKDDKKPRLLFMGSLYPYKGVDTFLSSLHHIPYPVTAIVGGKLKSIQEKKNLLNTAKAHLLTMHKIIFTGWLTDNEVRSLYHVADIFVYPTRGDTLPLCILEAMACGLPIVATSIGGIPFQLDNGAGFLLKSNRPEETAKLAMMLIENKKLRESAIIVAKKKIEETFNWDRCALNAIEGYQRILERR
ncbi:MAG: hypothetical protein A2V65_01665 [Deltaproteobacteria bacterium RBG_13_49_15]|nr:MAG: hypothetical protein A2V65_01665 [Deltaproteobacteria bacterium RBG_13_49_15]